MDWTQLLTIIGANLGTTIALFIWARTEANQDRRQILDLIRNIQDEMKDFHGRLCAIEERNRRDVLKS